MGNETLERFCIAQRPEEDNGRVILRCTYGANDGKPCPYDKSTSVICWDMRDAESWESFFPESIRYDDH
jgi:hypothetical protein